MNTFLTSFMGKLLGRSALYEQNNQETMTTERHIMSEHEFEQMVMRLRPRLMQMGRDFFGSDTEAEEVVQETWLRAWSVRERADLTDAYIMRIARNCCISMWRSQRTQVELTDGAAAVATEVTPQEEVEEHENSEWLQMRIKRLPPAEREVWQLFYDEGLTVEEIAQKRGTTVGTVRKTISNIRHTLRRDLRRRFLSLRNILLIIAIALATGIGAAVIIVPRGNLRGIMERMLHLPEDTTIYDAPDHVPTYHSDINALYTHLAANLHYPDSALADSIGGRVVVRFVVEKDGSLTNFTVIHSPDDRLSAEAIRVLKLTEPWIPARHEGRPVRSHFCVPVFFRSN